MYMRLAKNIFTLISDISDYTVEKLCKCDNKNKVCNKKGLS